MAAAGAIGVGQFEIDGAIFLKYNFISRRSNLVCEGKCTMGVNTP